MNRLAPPGPLRHLMIVALLSSMVAGCGPSSSNGALLVSPAEATAVVVRHWDVNRQALRATSGAQARKLIEQVEAGDALKIDEETIASEADARKAAGGSQAPIPDAADVRVFLPRQTSYPVTFMSTRTQALTDRGGKLTGKSDIVLELFRSRGKAEGWRNVAYAVVNPELSGSMKIALDSNGFAQFADGPPAGRQVSTSYTDYMNAALLGRPAARPSAVQPGPLTDQFATALSKALGAAAAVKHEVHFASSRRQDGIKLRTVDGGRLILFENLYDVVTTSSSGGCISGAPGTNVPSGPQSSVTDHVLQDVGALVPPGKEDKVIVIAEFDGPVAVDTRPCAAGTTI